MSCKYYRTRIRTIKKKRTIYNYCTLLKKEITYHQCQECNKKEYKQYKVLKKRTNKQNKRERERFSIFYKDLTKCCECGLKTGDYDKRINNYTTIAKNEIFEGAYRQRSITLGMLAPLCIFCHNKFHNDTLFNLKYKAMFQKEYLKIHTNEEFIKMFGQDYIYKLKEIKKVK